MKNKTEMNILHRIQLIKADMEKAACYQGEANRAMKKAQTGLSALINGTTITRKGMTPTTDEEREKLREAQAIHIAA